MTKIFVDNISTYKNNDGCAFEQNFIFAMCKEVRKHDSKAFDKASDYNRTSVKFPGFTLCAGGLLNGETLDQMLDDYFQRVHSTEWAVGIDLCTGYLMNADEFRCFVCQFCRLERESSKNGGKIKIRCRKSSKRMREWLDERV